MPTDWGMVQALIALIVIPLIIPSYWWSVPCTCVRWVRSKIRSHEGICAQLLWENLDVPDGQILHRCVGTGHHCPHVQHISGATCWKHTIGAFFDSTRQKHFVKKPAGLPLDSAFLCTDPKSIYAFILCTIADVDVKPIHDRPHVFDFGGILIKTMCNAASDEVLVHVAAVSSPRHVRDLTKYEVNCLLKGYPPFYRQFIPCNGFFVPSPIEDFDDVSRGGWVIGVGLSSTEPLPVYMDTLRDPATKRGMVFWRSIIRVKTVLENNFKVMFPLDSNVQATINAITYMIEEETQSGIERPLYGSAMSSDARLLSQPECILAMRIFNESPNLGNVELQILKERVAPILFPVLKAALAGVVRCVAYVKNPGREMDAMIPRMLKDAERVFVQGCS